MFGQFHEVTNFSKLHSEKMPKHKIHKTLQTQNDVHTVFYTEFVVGGRTRCQDLYFEAFCTTLQVKKKLLIENMPILISKGTVCITRRIIKLRNYNYNRAH